MDVHAVTKLLLPRVPLLFKTGLLHSLSFTPESSKWDLKTALIITTLRHILTESTATLTRSQRFSIKDPGVKGQMWVAPTILSIDATQDDVRQLLFQSIEDLKETGQEVFDSCELKSVEAEWTAHRPNVSNNTPPPQNLNGTQLYGELMSNVSVTGTILYFHGGGHYLCDPCSHRVIVSQLCKAAGGCRALSVRYRLAPQNPFPAGLLDCLIAYLSLLYPTQGSLHDAIAPEKVVFAGDSAGGNCCMSLLAFLLHLQRSITPDSKRIIVFNNHHIPLPLPLPGGVATNAAWNDLTRSMPSNVSNAHYDYLPYPSISLVATPASTAPAFSPNTGGSTPDLDKAFSIAPEPLPQRRHQIGETINPFPCGLWPATPPRADIYTAGESLCHPLVSPLVLSAEKWRGSCPLFFECGEEMLADEVQVLARRADKAGVRVCWAGFEAMPHCFAQILNGTEAAKKGVNLWGRWIGQAFKGEYATGGTWIEAKSLQGTNVRLSELNSDLYDEEVFARMKYERERRCKVFKTLMDRAKL